MVEPEEEILEDNDPIANDEFDADKLDINELDQDEIPERNVQLTGKISPFLARLQWWGTGILIAFIIFVVLRMVFGPPWIDRFRYARPPVTITENDGLIGVIVPRISERARTSSYVLFFVDADGKIRQQRNLGYITLGPLDLAMGDEYYYYIFGEASWIAARRYVQLDMKQNYDVDLNQFGVRLRDGIDLIRSEDGTEYLNVFIENLEGIEAGSRILTLEHDKGLWSLVNQFSSSEWSDENLRLFDLDDNKALATAGASFVLLDFPKFVDGYRKYNEATFLTTIRQRPRYPAEFFKPASLVSNDGFDRTYEFFLLKNDRMFNLPYKYSDDQVYVKTIESSEFIPFSHTHFNGKDIRGFVVVSNDATHTSSSADENSKTAEFVIVYQTGSDYRLAGLSVSKPQPLWDIALPLDDSMDFTKK